MDPSETIEANTRRHTLQVSYIACEGACPAASLRYLFGCCAGGHAVDIQNPHLGLVCGQARGDGFPDSACSAGDDRHPAVEFKPVQREPHELVD